MNKNRIALILIPTFLLLICIIGLILYDRHTYGDLQLSFSEKKELGEIIAKYDRLSLDFMAYSPNENCFCIDCDHTEYEIDKKTFDESAALYNEIMDYSEKNNTVFNGEKLELTIRNGSSLEYVILRNFTENAETAEQNECGYVTLSYYIGKTHKVFTSDIDSFMEEYAGEVFK